MRIVASTASMLEEPTRENEEPFWIQSRTFMSHGLLKAPWGSSIYKLRLSEALTLTEAASASLKLPYPHRYSSEATLSAQPRFGLFNYVALLGPISRYFWGTYKVRKMCLRNPTAKFSCLPELSLNMSFSKQMGFQLLCFYLEMIKYQFGNIFMKIWTWNRLLGWKLALTRWFSLYPLKKKENILIYANFGYRNT